MSGTSAVANGKAQTDAVKLFPIGAAQDASGATDADPTFAATGSPAIQAIMAPGQSSAAIAPPEHAGIVAVAPSTHSLATSPVSTNVDQALNGPAARSLGVDGTGIKIGILSDSFNILGGPGTDESDNALPAAGVTVLSGKEGQAGDTDEGRAMAQVIHSIAPSAALFFATSDGGDTAFANNITALVSAGCNIIVDDTVYFDEPFFQDGGVIDQAIENAAAHNVTFLTAAGNEANNFYQNSFTPISVNLPSLGSVVAENFGGGNVLQNVTIGAGATVVFDLQWAQSFETIGGSGATSSLALEVFSNGALVPSNPAETDVRVASGGNGDPKQLVAFQNTSTGAATVQVAIVENGGTTPTGQLFKYTALANGASVTINDPNAGIGSGTVFGHRDIAGEADVGAVNASQTPAFGTSPPQIEPFSSAGPGALLFDVNGNPVSVNPNQVVFAAPDGDVTSVPGFNAQSGGFFGTSAAAAAAAAAAALVAQANSSLTPADIDNLLRDSSLEIGGSSSTAAGGAGLIQANEAVQFAKNSTITDFSGSDHVQFGTHLGDTFTGSSNDTFIVEGGNNTINGGTGTNMLDYTRATGAVTANFSTGTASNGFGGTDQFSNIQVIRVAGNGNSLTGSTGNDTFVLAAGTNAAPVSGTDTFIAVSGSGDTLTGGGGNDTYMYDAGAGNATIVNGIAANNGPTGNLALGSGLDLSQVWFSPSNNDLAVNFFGSGSSIAVQGWFLNNANNFNQLQTFTLGDGAQFSNGSLARLISDDAATISGGSFTGAGTTSLGQQRDFFGTGQTDQFVRLTANGQLGIFQFNSNNQLTRRAWATSGGNPLVFDAATTAIGVGADFFDDGQRNLLLRQGNGQVAVYEINDSGQAAGVAVLVNAGASFTPDAGTSVIGLTDDFFGVGEKDMFARGSDGVVSVYEINNLFNGTSQVAGVGRLINGGANFTPDSGTTVIGLNHDFFGVADEDIFARSSNGVVSVYEINNLFNGTSEVAGVGTLVNGGANFTPDSGTTIIGLDQDFFGVADEDIFARGSDGVVSVYEINNLFNGTSQVAGVGRLINGGANFTPDSGTTVIGLNHDFFGVADEDIFARSSNGVVSVYEINNLFNGTSEVAGVGTLVNGGANFTPDSGTTIIGLDQDFFGVADEDIFARGSDGVVSVYEINNLFNGTSEVAGVGRLVNGGANFTPNSGATVIGLAHDFFGAGASEEDIFARSSNGAVSAYEINNLFNGTSQVAGVGNLWNTRGSAFTIDSGSSVVGRR